MAAHLTRAAGFDEQTALDEYARLGLRPSRWSNGPGDRYASHSHGYRKILYCLRGGITFELAATGERLDLASGDRLEIEPGTAHAAYVGPAGVKCIEAAC